MGATLTQRCVQEGQRGKAGAWWRRRPIREKRRNSMPMGAQSPYYHHYNTWGGHWLHWMMIGWQSSIIWGRHSITRLRCWGYWVRWRNIPGPLLPSTRQYFRRWYYLNLRRGWWTPRSDKPWGVSPTGWPTNWLVCKNGTIQKGDGSIHFWCRRCQRQVWRRWRHTSSATK